MFSIVETGKVITGSIQGGRTREELRAIAKKYPALGTKWHWCANPYCNKAVCLLQEPEGEMFLCCSTYCSDVALRETAGSQAIKPVESPVIRAGQSGKTHGEKAPPVSCKVGKDSFEPVKRGQYASFGEPAWPYLNDVPGKEFKCPRLGCGAILTEIPGSPGRCPACGEATFFLEI